MLIELPATIEPATVPTSHLTEDDNRLNECVVAIHKAYGDTSKKIVRAYMDFLKEVGPHLTTAHEIHKSRPDNSWGKWCREQLKWSTRHADRLRNAYDVITRLEKSQIKTLPKGEVHCRLLEKVGKDNKSNIKHAWNVILDKCGADASATVMEKTLAAENRYKKFFKQKTVDAKSKPEVDPETAIVSALKSQIAKLSPAKRKALLAKSVAELVEGGAA